MTVTIKSDRLKSGLTQTLIYIILIAGALWALFPFAWMVLTSLKGYAEASAAENFLPTRWLFSNYVDAWNAVEFFPRYFANTIFMAGATVAGVLITSTLAAYAFARMEFPGRDALFIVLLATMMVPFEVTLVPNFIVIRNLQWSDTYQALIIPWIASAFSIFLLRQFFRSIPQELHDAAVMDGCTQLRFLASIVLPLSRPALITSGLFTFLASWNSLMWPLLVTNRPEMRPIQVAMTTFIGDAGTQIQLLLAAVTISVIPVIIVYLILQRWFVEGIATVGIRG